jgi:CMP-N,N'-diacetyllegionaminic acid synthase
MSLLVVVPARGGSKRLPGKNVRSLAGRTLLERVADAIKRSELVADVLLTTDDEAIAAAGRALNWMVPFSRPAIFATDDAPMYDTVLHALDWYAGDRGGDPDMILLLQPTSPFRGGECLAQAVSRLQSTSDANSVIGMSKLKVRMSHVYALDSGGFAHPADPTSDRAAFAPNGTLYLVRAKAFREAGTLFARPMLPLVIDDLHAVDIDEPADWALAEALIAAGLAPDGRETTGRP